jgi:hypothetical protein
MTEILDRDWDFDGASYTADSYYLEHRLTGQLAHANSIGEHDGLVTDHVHEAARFDSFGDASDFAQNFGADWFVVGY